MFISHAGNVYELGFKVGFAKGAIYRSKEEAKEVWKQKLHLLLSLRGENLFGKFSKVLENLPKEALYGTRMFQDREKSLRKFIEETGIRVEGELEKLLALYSTGLYEGLFLVKNLPSGNLIPVVFGFSSELSTPGVYENVDMLFRIEGKEVHIYDLKLYGGAFHIVRLLTPYQKKIGALIPPVARGIQLSISLGERNLTKFVMSLLEAGKTLLERGEFEVSPEFKYLIQVFSYFLDFLSREEVKEPYGVVGLIYSTTDAPVFRFPIERKDYTPLANELKKLYSKIKTTKEGKFARLTRELSSFTSIKGTLRRINKITEEVERENKELLRKIAQREKKRIVIIPEMKISELREKTRKDVEHFYNSNPWGKAIVLLHSTGAGKTHSIREVFLKNSKDKIIFFYFAPRIQLLKEEKEKIEKENIPSVWIYKKEDENDEVRFKRIADEGLVMNKVEAKIKSAVDKVNTLITENRNKIAVFLTTQSITGVAGRNRTTFRHIETNVLRWINRGYKIVIALDEITGAKSGFLALHEALRLMNRKIKVSEKPEKEWKEKVIDLSKHITLLVFDATLHSKGVFEKVLREWNKEEFISPAFIFSDLEREGELEIAGIPFRVRTGYSYPAKELIINEKFIVGSSRKEVISQIALLCIQEAQKQKNNGHRLFVYIQDRHAVMELKNLIQEAGFNVFAITSNLRDSAQVLEKDDLPYDVVISTSTLSRGINLKQNFTKAIIITFHFLGIEEGAIEDLQAGARMRGMKNDEQIPKEILRIYAVFTDDEDESEVSEVRRMALSDRIKTLMEIILEEEGIEESQSLAIESELKTLLKKLQLRDALKGMLIYADLILNLYESFYRPKNKIVAVIPAQSKTVYYPETLSRAGRLFSFLKELRDYACSSDEEKKLVNRFMVQLLRAFCVLPEVPISKESNIFKGYYPPYLVVENELRLFPNDNETAQLFTLYKKIKDVISEGNPEILKEFDNLFNELFTGRKRYVITSLVYIPAVAVAYECIDKNFASIPLYFPKRITRHNVEILGASLGLYAQIRINPFSKNVESVVFPVSASETHEWIKNPYPRIDGELLLELINFSSKRPFNKKSKLN